MASLAEELANLSNTTPQSLDPEDDIYEETRAKISTENLDEEEKDYVGSVKVGKKLQSVDNLGPKYRGKKVSRITVEEVTDESKDLSSDEDAGNDLIHNSLLDQLVDVSDSNNEISSDEDTKDKNDDDEEDDNDLVTLNDESQESENELLDEDEEIDSDEAEGNVDIFNKPEKHSSMSKGQATANQMGLWDKLLETRIKVQKSLSLVNQLPLPNMTGEFFKQDEDLESLQHSTVNCISALLNKLTDLQEYLLSYNGTEIIKQNGSNRKRKSNLSINELHEISNKHFKDFKTFRNSTLQLWYDKTRLASNSINAKSFNNFERATNSQIEEILKDKQRLLKRTQLQRTEYRILGTSKEELEINNDNNEETETYNRHLKQYNDEVFDDDDFYQQLLRNLIEQRTSTSTSNDPTEITRQWLKIQKLRTKVKNKVDHKAGKGRKVRYDVHPKLVSFMGPCDDSTYTHDARNRLFKSLFGKRQDDFVANNTNGFKLINKT